MNFARNLSKQMEVTEYSIDRYTFYIYPLPAFTAAYLSTEVVSLLAPLFGGMAGAFKGKESSETDKKTNLLDMDVGEAAPYIGAAFSSLSPAKMESLLRKLLTSGQVSVCADGKPDAQILTEDICNEVFCRNTQNMFLVAFMVLKVNYADFFEKIATQSGNVKDMLKNMGFPSMEPLTPEDSAN